MSERLLFPFEPVATQGLSVTTSSARVAMSMRAGAARVAVVTNPDATGLLFVNFGDSTVTSSSTTGTPVLPASQTRISAPVEATHMAFITGTGSFTAYLTEGTGN